MGLQGEESKKALLWGQILVGIGVVAIVAGVLVWILIEAVVLPDSTGPVIADIAVGGICCFGPLALLGVVMVIIGGILWNANKRAMS